VSATHQPEAVAAAAPGPCVSSLHFAIALFLAVIRGLSAEDSVSDTIFCIEAVHLDHNRPNLLTTEINSLEVQEILLRKPTLTAPPSFLAKLQLEVVFDRSEVTSTEENGKSKNEEEFWRLDSFGGIKILWPSAAAKESVPEIYRKTLEDYLKTRLSGHTKAYALASIQKKGIRPAVAEQSLLILLREYPDVPYSCVKKATRKIGIDPLPRATEYHVVDGPIVWVFSVSTQQNSVLVERADAQETDERLAPKFEEARQEARTRLEQRGIKPKLGYVHAYWPELKKVLKEKHGIVWRSRGELNPYVYD